MLSTQRRQVLALTLIFVACLAPLTVTRAQDTVTGAFEGMVFSSQTGAAIGGAAVQIINQETNLTIPKQTDARGRFYQGLLTPGIYLIRVSAPNFQTREVVQRLFITRTGEVVPVPVQLDPVSAVTPAATPTPIPAGGVATAAAANDIRAEINRVDARRGGAFTEEQVETLPLGGATFTRTFDELALLLAGVAAPPQTIGNGSGPGIGAGVGSAGQFAVNGIRSRANNFTVDGSDNNDEDIGVRRQGFLALVPQPIESIKEYQAITLLPPAQFGRNIGAQVNAVSKSGGNELHGSIYSFFNSSQLNARNFFDSTSGNNAIPVRSGNQSVIVAPQIAFNNRTLNFDPVGGSALTVLNGSGGKDSLTLGQGGLVMGGAAVPNKVFYFFSAEGYILNAAKEASFAVPTIAQRGAFGSGATGLVSDPINGGRTFAFPTTKGGDAIFSLFPFPNNPEGVYGGNTFTQTLPADGRGVVASAKFDGNFHIKNRLQTVTARYNYTKDWRDLPVTGGAIFSTIRPRVQTQNFSFFLNSEVNSPNSGNLIFNQVRLSYGRTRLKFEEVRNNDFLLPSRISPETPFLLNARQLNNFTLPNIVNNALVPNAGPVVLLNSGDTESELGVVEQVNVAGFSPIGVDVFSFPQRRVNNTYQVADALTWRVGKHSLAFGTDNRRTELNSELPRNFRPLITFSGAPEARLASDGAFSFTGNFVRPENLAAASAASGFSQTLTTGSDSGINLRYYQINLYGQDEWRVRQNLSLSYGLRYEYNTPVKETNGRVESTFTDPAVALVPGLAEFIGGRRRIFDPDLNNFAPRVGIAYSTDLLRHGQPTIFRAGYGIYYDQILGAVASQSRSVFPTFLTVNLAGGLGNLGFPNAALSLLNPSNESFGLVQPGTLNRLNTTKTLADIISTVNLLASAGGALPSASGVEITLPARKLKTPTAEHFSVAVEQQLGTDHVLSAAYVGTRGRHLLNLTTPNLGSNAILLPDSFSVALSGNTRFEPQFKGIAVQPGTRINAAGEFVGGRPVPGVGGVNIYDTAANSNYDAMQIEFRGRFRKNLQYYASYTLSKADDTVSDVFNLAGAPALPQDSQNLAEEFGPANFDVRHRFTYYFIYDFQGFRNKNPFMRASTNGLQIAGTGRISSGQPFTVNSIYDVNLDGNLTDRLNTTTGLIVTGDRRRPLLLNTPNTNSLLAPIGQDGQVGRNTFRAGGIVELDLTVNKGFVISDKYRLNVRMDVFNFINRANFGIPVRYLEAPGFGEAVDTVTPGRRIQFSIKFTF